MDKKHSRSTPKNALTRQATITIVNQFMKSQLNEKGCIWNPQTTGKSSHPAYNETSNTRLYDDEELARILESLNAVARELQVFTQKVHKEQFPRIVSSLDIDVPEVAHDAFNSIADELFAEGISWSHIITLLVFGKELAYNCIENEKEDMVDHIPEWMANYIDLKILAWIENQGGWESIRDFAEEKASLPDEDNKKTLKIFFGLAASVAILGIIVLCSKQHA